MPYRDYPNMEPSRKRKRSTIVCTVCKARKVRCDRRLPCNSCIKHKLEHLCGYDESDAVRAESETFESSPSARNIDSLVSADVYLVPTTTADVLARFSALRSVLGVNPVLLPKDRINFYLEYSLISFDPHTMEEVNHGPFSWHLTVRTDPGLAHLWNFIMNIKPVAGPDRVPNVYSKTAQRHKQRLQLQVLDRIRQHLVVKFDVNLGQQRDIPLGLSFNDPHLDNASVGLDERLLSILPCERVLWSHVDRFFRLLYPFYPFLDEEDFRSNVARILRPQGYSGHRYTAVHASGRLDHAILGLLCIVLRMSYLALISNDQLRNAQMMASPDSLLASPVGIEAVDFAKLCLDQSVNRTNLHVLQLVAYIRIYLELSPEDPDGPSRDMYQVNNGVLLQMGYSIGLNREPDKMTDTLVNPHINHVRRKLWTFIQFKDVVNSLKFGLPFILRAFSADTKFPFLNEQNGNSADPNLDVYVQKSLAPLERLIPLMKKAVYDVLQVDEDVALTEMVQKINTLEVSIFNELGLMRDLQASFTAEGEQGIVPVLLVQYYVPVHVFLISVYFRLFLKYERASPLLAYFYSKKIITLMAKEVLPFVNEILDKPHPYFEFAAQLVINPHLEYFMHRSTGFIAGYIIRLGHQIHVLEQIPPNTVTSPENRLYISKLKFLMRSMSRCVKVCLLGIQKMNHRYCYAWRIGTTFTYILRCLVLRGFYSQSSAKDFEHVPKISFTEDQVDDLITVLELLLRGLDLSKFENYWTTVQDVIRLGKGEPGSLLLFNPTESSLMFGGLPDNAADLGIGGAGIFPASSDLLIDPSWFPVFDTGKDVTSVMETFFDGPESYFDAFSNATNPQLSGGFGMT